MNRAEFRALEEVLKAGGSRAILPFSAESLATGATEVVTGSSIVHQLTITAPGGENVAVDILDDTTWKARVAALANTTETVRFTGLRCGTDITLQTSAAAHIYLAYE